MSKIISNQIIPHFNLKKALFAFGQIKNIYKNQNIDFSNFFGTKNYLLFNAARTALSVIIENLNLPKNKKIGIPAFICAVVATPFLEKNYEIEWIDTDQYGNIDYEDFIKKSKNISLVVIPHIFGQKISLAPFYKYCQKHKIFLVEDCSHFFDIDMKFCDAKIISFGREKDISCITGGCLIWKNNFLNFKKKLSTPKKLWTIRHLCQPLIFALTLPIWNFGGKIIVWFLKKIKFLPLAVTAEEKKGIENFPKKLMPYPIQNILKNQLLERKKILEHKILLAKEWQKILKKISPKNKIVIPPNFFRVILYTKNRNQILSQAKKIKFFLQEWEGSPIAPQGVVLKKFGYKKNSCPQAEFMTKNYITFPTNIRTTKKDVKNFEKFLLTNHHNL